MFLNVDTTRNALVASQANPIRVAGPVIVVGDTVPVTLVFLQRNTQALNTGSPIYNFQDFSAAGVVFSLGPINTPPTGGTFTLTFGANTTPALPYNVSPYALSDALNLLASVVSAGGVTVAGQIGGPFFVTFVSNGVQSAFTSAANALFPASVVGITTDRAGSSTNPAVQAITLVQSQAAQISSWTAQSAAAVTVTQISGNAIQRVSIPAGTYGGSFTLTYNGNTTAAIPFAAQLDVVAAALNALPGITGATVWPGQNFWDITIPSGAFTLTGNASGLIIPLTLTGNLVLTARAIADLLAGQASAVVPFYIQTTNPTVLTQFAGTIQLTLP